MLPVGSIFIAKLLHTVPRLMKAFDKRKSYKSRQFGVHGLSGAACECDKTVMLSL